MDDHTEAGRGAPLLPGPFAAVVLDLDGLLVLTEDLWSHAKEILFGRHGVAFRREDHLAVFGTSERETAVYFALRFGLDPARADDIRHEYMSIASELMGRDLDLTEGARELVAWLQGRVPLGLASNTRRELVERILAGVGLGDAFDVVVTGDDGPPKPAPDLYLLACRRLGVDPAAAVALEDSPTGVSAARAAGLTCIGVPSAPEVPLPEADHVVRSLREVTPPDATGAAPGASAAASRQPGAPAAR
jgi:HAD superfamily hydrolase (TIGR01509 family)